VLLFFGNRIYQTALEQSGDTLNGILLICFGVVGLFYTIFYNILRTNLDFGLFMSIIQYIIYIPITVIGVLTVIVLLAFFVNTRPVYHINGR
jgi:putative Mn2+ efflux pump MntP